jgi:hypothetical protein
MKPELLDDLEKKKYSRLIKILVIVVLIFIGTFFTLIIGKDIYCHTVDFCEVWRPPMTAEMIAKQLNGQYDLAIVDIEAGRYENAKKRLEYVLALSPKHPGVSEKLAEVEKILNLTPAP